MGTVVTDLRQCWEEGPWPCGDCLCLVGTGEGSPGWETGAPSKLCHWAQQVTPLLPCSLGLGKEVVSPLKGDCEDRAHQHISSSQRPAQVACSPHSLGLQHPISGVGVTDPCTPDARTISHMNQALIHALGAWWMGSSSTHAGRIWSRLWIRETSLWPRDQAGAEMTGLGGVLPCLRPRAGGPASDGGPRPSRPSRGPLCIRVMSRGGQDSRAVRRAAHGLATWKEA